MAGKQQMKERNDKKIYYTIEAQKTLKSENPLLLKRAREDQIVEALVRYGTKTMIGEYRSAKLEPPVDLLLSHFEQHPSDITPKESVLLQKAYGRDFMEAQYKRLQVSNPMAKMGMGSRIAGWFGRKFGSYKRLKHNDNGPVLKSLAEASNVLLAGIKKMEHEGADENGVNAIEDLLTAKFNAVDHKLQEWKPINEGGKEVPEMGGQEGRIEVGHLPTATVLQRAAEKGQRSEGKDGEETGVAVLDDGFIDEWKSYHTFIHLHGYSAQKFKHGMIQFRSPEIALGLGSLELFTLKDTDFLITYDPNARTEMVAMNKGSGSIQLGALTISAKEMIYTSLDDTFTAKSVKADLNAGTFFDGTADLSDVTVDRTGVHLKEVSIELKKLDIFSGAFQIISPNFHMVKEDSKWMKDISIGGMVIDAKDAFSLTLSKKQGKDDGENAWMFKETSDTSQVSGSASGWVPNIHGAAAELKVGTGFEASLDDINFDSTQMSASSINVTLNAQFAENSVTATAEAVGAGYSFNSKKPYLNGMSGSIALTFGENTLSAELTDMNYLDGAITISSLTGTFPLGESKLVTLQGEGISYSEAGVFDFQRLSGSVDGDMTLLDAIKMKGICVSVEKEGGSEEGEAEKSKDSDEAYQISLEVSEGEIDVKGVHMTLGSGSFSVSDKGEFGSGMITEVGLDIADGMIRASGQTMSYSKDEEKLSAAGLGLSLALNGVEQTITAETAEYKKDSGFSVTGINAKLDLNLGGNKMTAELSDASYDGTEGFVVKQATVTAMLMGKNIELEGKELQYTPEKKVEFESLSAKLGDWSIAEGFTIADLGLTVSKGTTENYIVEASSKTVSLSASGIKLSAGTTSFEITENKLSKASLSDAKIEAGGIFSVMAESVDYSNDDEDGLTLNVNKLAAVHVSEDAKGFSAAFTIESGLYSGGEFSLKGFNGSLGASLAGITFAVQINDGAYEKDELTIEKAAVDATILKQNLSFTGTGLKYSKTDGMDFASLELTTKEKIEIGSFMTIDDGKAGLAKENGEVSLTISGSADADIENIAKLQVKDAELSLSGGKVASAKMGEGYLNLGSDMIVITVKALDYLPNEETFSANGLHGNAKFGGQSLKVGAENLSYMQDHVSMDGVSMDANMEFGFTRLDIGFTDGSFENQALTVGMIQSSLKICKTDIAMMGENVVFSKAGIDFEKLAGNASGELTPFEGSGITITNPGVTVTKAEGNYNTKLSSDRVAIDAGGIKLDAKNMIFEIEASQLKSASVESAELDISNKMIFGRVADLCYETGEGDGYSFSSKAIVVQMNAGNNVKGNATIESLSYEDKLFTLNNMNAFLTAKMAGNDVTASLQGASYDVTQGLTAETASVGMMVLSKTVTLTGEELAYSPDKEFSFKKLSAKIEENLNVLDTILLTNAETSIEKEGTEYTVNVSSGVSTIDKKTLDLNAENVAIALVGGELQKVTLTNISLNVMEDLIAAKGQNVDLCFLEKKLSAQGLEINVKSKALGNVPALKGISQFLKGISVKVGDLSYSKPNGLTYSDIDFSGDVPAIRVGSYLTVTPDLKNKSISGELSWMFPGGEMVDSGDEKTEGGKDQEPDKAQGEKKYKAPSLLEIPVDIIIVPGISLTAKLDIGAGFRVAGDLSAKIAETSNYQVNLGASLAGQAYVAADLGVSVGVANVAALTAAGYARAELNLKGTGDMKTNVDFSNTFPKLSNSSVAYAASADVSLSVGVNVKAKFLFFEGKTLYEKELGAWELGKISFSGNAGVDPETGNIIKDDVVNNINANGKGVGNDAFGKKISKNKGKKVGTLEEVKGKTIEEIEAQLTGMQAERGAMETALLDSNVQWGIGGGEASKMLVTQVEKMAELYNKELAVMCERINLMENDMEKKYLFLVAMGSSVSEFARIATDVKEDSHDYILDQQHSFFEQQSSHLNIFSTKTKEPSFDKGAVYERFYRVLELRYINALQRHIKNATGDLSISAQMNPGNFDKESAKKEFHDVLKMWKDVRNGKYFNGDFSVDHVHKAGGDILAGEILGLEKKRKEVEAKSKTKTEQNLDQTAAICMIKGLRLEFADDFKQRKDDIYKTADEYNENFYILKSARGEKDDLEKLRNQMASFLKLQAPGGSPEQRTTLGEICSAIKTRNITKTLKELKESEAKVQQILDEK